MRRLAIVLVLVAGCHKRSKGSAEQEAATLTGGREFVRCAGTSGDGCAGSYGDGWICIAPASSRAIFCPGDERKPCSIIPMGNIPAEQTR